MERMVEKTERTKYYKAFINRPRSRGWMAFWWAE